MRAYIIRRLLWAVPILFGAITLVFFLLNVLPGDIATIILGGEEGIVNPEQVEMLREQLGLNRPLYEQYFSWLSGVVRLDFGTSLWTGRTVVSELALRLPYTTALVVLSVLISIITAIPIGIISALRQDSWLDYTLRSGVIAGISIPNFWFAMLIVLLIVQVFGWFPPIAYATPWGAPWRFLQQIFLPAITLGFRSSAASARMMRSSMLEVLREDYVRTARAKGLTERMVIYAHALRNAILPVVTIFGMQLAYLFGGTVIIELIFNIPGVGLLLIDSLNRRDVPVVAGVVVFIAVVIVIVNLLVDLLYAWIDPRIRYH